MMITNYKSTGKPVLFFDGVCNLCNGAVQFIIRHDRKKMFLFSSLQSASGQQLKADYNAANHRLPDSLVLYYQGKYYLKSSAVLKIAECLGGWLWLLLIFRIIPRFLRDFAYDQVAGHRYKWFGERKECYLPTPELSERFLD
jgi:predicted DCC family thiol-disulfide oxidoreductase YuxK